MISQEYAEAEKFLAQREAEIAQMQMQGQGQNPYLNLAYSGQKQNLIEWELDFKPELDAIIRLLRCDVLIKDKDGYEDWAPNTDKSRILFNEWGVADLIRNIVIIVNKGKALSYYNPEEISERVRQMKHELRTLIYNNYEVYEMDNEYKMNNYSMVVMSIGSIIEDVYRRAMNGETHKGLSEQRLVSQNEPLGSGGTQNFNIYQPQQKKGFFSRLLPWNWGR